MGLQICEVGEYVYKRFLICFVVFMLACASVYCPFKLCVSSGNGCKESPFFSLLNSNTIVFRFFFFFFAVAAFPGTI